jgi:hypothetical protein
MNAGEIAEIVLRLRDRLVALGEPQNCKLLASAEAAVEELLNPSPLTTDELTTLAAFGSYVGSEAIRKIGEANAKRN